MVRHSPGAGLTGGNEVNPGSGREGIERSAWRAMAPMRISRVGGIGTRWVFEGS